MHYLGDFLFDLCYGVGKGVARYPLHLKFSAGIFAMGETRLRGGECPNYNAIFLMLSTAVILF